MSYHEIDLFGDEAKAKAKVAEHIAAGRKDVKVTPSPGYDSVIVYDCTKTSPIVIFDKDTPPVFFVVESDGD